MSRNTVRGVVWAQRFTTLGLLVTLSSGCALSETTTSIRSLPSPPMQRLRLIRAGEAPVQGAFHQQGHSVVGQLSFTDNCAEESSQVVRQQEVSETHAMRGRAIGWAIAGGVISAVGTGFLIASASADKSVTCGDGSGNVQGGTQCDSMSSAEFQVGLTTLAIGVGAAVLGGLNLARQPSTETKELPVQNVVHVAPGPSACGSKTGLDGLVAAFELPGNGTWSGSVANDGTVRIDVNERIPFPEHATAVPVVVVSVPASSAGLVSPGTALGEVTLRASPAQSSLNAPRRLVLRR